MTRSIPRGIGAISIKGDTNGAEVDFVGDGGGDGGGDGDGGVAIIVGDKPG